MAEEVGNAVVSGVASKVAEIFFDPILQRISYVLKYQSYLDDLTKKAEELKDKKQTVEEPVNRAKRQGEEIYDSVKKWLSDVDEFTERVANPIIEDEDKAKKRCFRRLYPNLIQRYTLGKKAVKATKDVAELLGKGNFDTVSYRPVLQRTESVYIRGYEAFNSRQPVLKEIMEALKDVNVNMIGVYGMPGVGKTTLVKKVAWQAKEGKLFDEVVMAGITETADIKKIQGEISDQLGLNFEEESVAGRADRLRNRLKSKDNSILVILDDLWAKLDLDKVGIPFQEVEKGSGQGKDDVNEGNDCDRRFTILLTSRHREVLCNDMNVQNNFLVDLLSDQEAWDLFRKIVGECGEMPDFQPIAQKIVGKCARLPIAIYALANALKNKPLFCWKDALKHLERSNLKRIPAVNETLFSTIEVSYNLLKDEEAKSLLLLCCLLNAGYNIHIDELLKYSMGLGWLNGYILEEARDRLRTLLHDLKSSCLLLDGMTIDFVKMHDIVHAVAVSIASSDKLMFNVQNVGDLEAELEDKLKDPIAISLPYRDICNDQLPESLKCLKLKLFILFMGNHSVRNSSLEIPDLFFKQMDELKVLDFRGIRLLPLPSSLCDLRNLQTLSLIGCLLGDIAMVGQLRMLEFLSLVRSEIEKLPREIGQLTKLKLLNLRSCSKLKEIEPNVISSLSQLEELYMGNSFNCWEIEGQKNASLLELKQLSHLTSLEIHVQDIQIIPQGLFSEKLTRYIIFVGDMWDWFGKFGTFRTLKLKFNCSIYLVNRVKSLLKRSEDIHLAELKGIKYVVGKLDEDGFPLLKHLYLENGLELLNIVNSTSCKHAFPKLESLTLHNLINLEKICHGQLNAESFNNLRVIKLKKCDKLKYLFSSIMAKNLSQLQEIEVINCQKLVEIFHEESEVHVDEIHANGEIIFTQLRCLALQYLPEFTSICFNGKVMLTGLENLKLSSISIGSIWLDRLPPAISSYCQSLKSISVGKCNGLNFLFTASMVKSLEQLEKLVIDDCKSMEAVIHTGALGEEEKIMKMSFPKLFYLKLKALPNLKRFGTGNLLEFPSLNELQIESCSNLKTFFSD